MSAYYNENDGFAAGWLRGLVEAGHVAPGRVDDRSIEDVRPEEIGEGQAHFFAGVGGWSLALRLAGVPDDVRVWTGSCPCQPFSDAGKKRGLDDERHLWPEWFRLIRECRPPIIFGEQVASRDGLVWLDAVLADLEGEGYACAAADLCAASVGAPHIRQRLYFVAHAEHAERRAEHRPVEDGRDGQDGGREEAHGQPGARGEVRAVADAAHADGRAGERGAQAGARPGPERWRRSAGRGPDGGVGDADRQRREERRWAGTEVEEGAVPGRPGWDDIVWLRCSDGKARPTKPGLHPLAHGVPGRVGRLRAYGNAIVPPLAEQFIRTVMEILDDARL